MSKDIEGFMSEYSKFRFDVESHKYTKVIERLNFKFLIYKLSLEKGLGNRINTLSSIKPDDLFGSCSYWELTECALARIEWIRDSADCINNSVIREQYPIIVNKLKECIKQYKIDIINIMRMRRDIKRKTSRV